MYQKGCSHSLSIKVWKHCWCKTIFKNPGSLGLSSKQVLWGMFLLSWLSLQISRFFYHHLCNPNPSSWWDSWQSRCFHWHDLLLSTISCSPSPFSKWDSSQTECFCWRWLGHWWGRCWSSTSHLCRPSSRQRRYMFQVCTTVCLDPKPPCALCKILSSVYTHQLTAISVYTSPCLHPVWFTPTTV